MKEQDQESEKDKARDREFPGYPSNPPGEDIYRQEKEEVDIDPEDPTQHKKILEDEEAIDRRIERDREMDGEDLDVPGAELDDDQEAIGSEDEENNYYSLGGDNHNELEETEN